MVRTETSRAKAPRLPKNIRNRDRIIRNLARRSERMPWYISGFL